MGGGGREVGSGGVVTEAGCEGAAALLSVEGRGGGAAARPGLGVLVAVPAGGWICAVGSGGEGGRGGGGRGASPLLGTQSGGGGGGGGGDCTHGEGRGGRAK